MHDQDNQPAQLVRVPTDLEAAMIVSALAAHEVDATTGESTSGFRAEAPGLVTVLVRQSDLTRARQVLSQLSAERPATTRPQSTAAANVFALAHGQRTYLRYLWLSCGAAALLVLLLQLYSAL